VEATDGNAEGLLTAYYEPMMDAARQPGNGYTVPVYRLPAGLWQRKPWYTRQQIDTLPEAQAALQGAPLPGCATRSNPWCCTSRARAACAITEADGRVTTGARGLCGHQRPALQSVGRWLLDQGANARCHLARHPRLAGAKPAAHQRVAVEQPALRVLSRRALEPAGRQFGPRGAQGVPLTPGRSIAVDRQSIPYGTPVWLASTGPQVSMQRLVMAQDTGSAIVGAVRADYFAGWGAEAGELAGRLKQGLRLWALWPR
jgi:membrane-bound lytic murein transglycosylase A